ncbi:hypothetical protein [Bifidobacterium cebidarum]|uniref:Uncharacterized protein n=1 Tax=Bifidobacterium cebidarum TaxID=2650773 RepID=A0A6I1G8P3_9BIFI|nr:hypothetical protein [Bifidobacterium cebidarum]KAB7787980.1 hypothetical protein F7D08_1374 [Bifidobacterium cebidarum]
MKKFFQGLSFSSIVAGTLAAVTSFLLAAKIGVAGSVIGAAASYIVSVVATNIYQNIIKASSEKFQQTISGSDEDDKETGESDNTAPERTSGDVEVTHESDSEADSPSGSSGAKSVDESGETRSIASDSVRSRKPREIVSRPSDGHTYSISELRKRRRDPKRVAVIVTLVSGLLTVAVTAGIVMLVTQGHGTDTVVSDLVSPTTSSENTDDSTSSSDSNTQSGNNGPAVPQYGSGDSKSDTTGSDSSTADNTTSGSTSDSTGTGSSTDTSSSGSGATSGSDSSNSTSSNGSTNSDSTSGSTSDSNSSGSTSGSTGSSSSSDSSSSSSSSSGTTSGSTGSSSTGSSEGTSFNTVK